jgi:four helix bundle protein
VTLAVLGFSLDFIITEKVEGKRRMTGSFKDLIVWQRAVQLSLSIYKLTASFPANEQFGLTNQLRRASVSIASNIAEGYGRSSKGEYLQFLGHARGSNCEVQTQLVIAMGLGSGRRQKGTLRKVSATRLAGCWL